MVELQFERQWRNINCLIPIYDQYGGNSTEVWLTGGNKVTINNKTNTVLKNIAKVFAVDLSQLKKKYGNLVGRKSSTPLPLHPDLILIPIKIREPLAKDEGARGYIVKSKIESYGPVGCSQTEFKFWDGTVLPCLQSVTSINLSMAHAEIISRECQKSYQTEVREREEIYQVVAAVLSSLAKNRKGY
jgi:hypothetical protein